jgi:acyl-CoA synthetase (AMP-forming)/AMP-acid ligase II
MSDTATQFTVPAVARAVAAAIGDRELLIQGAQCYSYAQAIERSNRLAAYLHSRGLGCHTERSALAGHEVGQDLLGIYAYNGNQFVETLLGTFQARVAPFNVNFRYVKSELQYLLADSGATALVYHGAFAPRVAEVLPPRNPMPDCSADDDRRPGRSHREHENERPWRRRFLMRRQRRPPGVCLVQSRCGRRILSSA